jgi:hypothetical protein
MTWAGTTSIRMAVRPIRQIVEPALEFDLAFPFWASTDNLLMASDAFIHAGFNVTKTLWRSTPNG